MTPLDDRNWQPATLHERGASVPFTSPMLAGARVRVADGRCDLLVPHPGGVRGVFIFALSSLAEFCTPTLHDSRLAERLATLRPLHPAAIRGAARLVAAEGAAGRAAACAAKAAADQHKALCDRFELLLLHAVVGHDGGAAGSPEHRQAHAVQKLAGRTGRDAEAVRADVGLLSGVLAGSGLDGPGPDGTLQRGRCGLLLDSLEAMRSAMLAWSGDLAGTACGQLAESARAVTGAGRQVLAASHKLLDDPVALLGAWATNPAVVAGRLCRPDWLLDGWEHLCLLWQVAETDDQRTEAVAEVATLLPPMPPEADAWLSQPELLAALRTGPRDRPGVASMGPPSRPPSQVVALIARNERIRSLAA